jgi:membrane protease YdiL (CAAX protease family)
MTSDRPRPLPLSIAIALWASVGLAAVLYGIHNGYGGSRYVAMVVVTLWLFGTEIVLASDEIVQRISKNLPRAVAALLCVLPLLAYIVYAVGTRHFVWSQVSLVAGMAFIPTAFAAWAGSAPFGAWQDYAAMATLFVPFWLGWVQYLWPYPTPKVTYAMSVLLIVQIGEIAFLLVRRAPDVGFAFAWSRKWLLVMIACFVGIGLIDIPLALKIHFMSFDPSHGHHKEVLLELLGTFLFTAWAEEFFFRGLLQNALSRTLRSDVAGLIVGSIVFGFSHINHEYFPNWKYVLLATIAGLFYGFAWKKTGSMTGSGVIHAAVDVTMHQLFRIL